MRQFARLICELEQCTDDVSRLQVWQRYLAAVSLSDAAWAVHLTTKYASDAKVRRAAQPVKLSLASLRDAACRLVGIERWLFDACRQDAGGVAQTIAHLLPQPQERQDIALAQWMEQRLPSLAAQAPQARADALALWLQELEPDARVLVIGLACANWRKRQDPWPVQRALARHAGIDPSLLALRMQRRPAHRATTNAEGLAALWSPLQPSQAEQRALPVARAQPRVVDFALDDFDRRLGPSAAWTVQWAYDGQRAQLVRVDGAAWLWSATGELLNDRFAQLTAAANDWPDGTVVDGVVVVHRQGAHEYAVLIADRLPEPWIDRHAVAAPCLTASSWLEADTWRDRSRAQGAIGLRLTPVDSNPRGGTAGAARAWLWPADPLRIRAVLIHAEAASGFRGRGAYRYTFALWSRAPRDPLEVVHAVEAVGRGDVPKPAALQLMPVAKIHVDLEESAQRAVAHTLVEHALRRFGPVQVVKPRLVFELGYEAVAINTRRKAGVELIRPAVLRLLPLAPLDQVDTCVEVRALATDAPALSPAVAAAR